uniref:Tail assembly chaperone n=1 Tax=Micrococcus phage Kurnik TaxID=3092208 RepID=A0AAU6R630_9CAUD
MSNCDQCRGDYPLDSWPGDQYDGHWDTCPNRPCGAPVGDAYCRLSRKHSGDHAAPPRKKEQMSKYVVVQNQHSLGDIVSAGFGGKPLLASVGLTQGEKVTPLFEIRPDLAEGLVELLNLGFEYRNGKLGSKDEDVLEGEKDSGEDEVVAVVGDVPLNQKQWDAIKQHMETDSRVRAWGEVADHPLFKGEVVRPGQSFIQRVLEKLDQALANEKELRFQAGVNEEISPAAKRRGYLGADEYSSKQSAFLDGYRRGYHDERSTEETAEEQSEPTPTSLFEVGSPEWLGEALALKAVEMQNLFTRFAEGAQAVYDAQKQPGKDESSEV